MCGVVCGDRTNERQSEKYTKRKQLIDDDDDGTATAEQQNNIVSTSNIFLFQFLAFPFKICNYYYGTANDVWYKCIQKRKKEKEQKQKLHKMSTHTATLAVNNTNTQHKHDDVASLSRTQNVNS